MSGVKRRHKALRRFKPYLEYRDSGIEWLGEVPKHWGHLPVKRVASVRYGLGEPPRESADGLPFIRATNVASGRIEDHDLKRVDPEDVPWSRDPMLRTGDIIVVRSGAYTGDSAIIPAAYDGAIAGYDMVVRARHVLPRFLAWSLLSDYMLRAQIETASTRAAQPHLNAEDLGSVIALLPPLPEQQAVSAFLDMEAARIDALVAKKERLIELLQEERTALITRTVTKGLVPGARMKDSGVDWLGAIPAHWEVRPLKAVSGLQTGLTLGKKFEGRSLVTRPYLRVANVQDGFLALDDVTEVELPIQDAGRYELQKGDVLLTEGGDFDKLGRGHVWEGQVAGCLHQNHIFAVRPHRERLRPYFLAHVLSSGYGRAYFTATSKQSTNLASTNSGKLRNLPVPLPSLLEQEDILTSIRRETGRIDALVERVRSAISRLHELRTSLICAAVTGKIDVRGSLT